MLGQPDRQGGAQRADYEREEICSCHWSRALIADYEEVQSSNTRQWNGKKVMGKTVLYFEVVTAAEAAEAAQEIKREQIMILR